MRTCPVMSAAYAVLGAPGRPERPLRDAPILGAREDRAPVLELVDVAGRFVAEDLDRVLVAQVVRALDRVERMLLGAVLGGVPERGVDPALGRAGVAADRMDLREERDVGAEIVCLDRGAHPGAPGADNQDVVCGFHQQWTLSNGRAAVPCDSCGESLARSGVRGPGLVAPGPRTLVVSDSMPAHRAGSSPLPLADDKVHLRTGRPAQTGPRALCDHVPAGLVGGHSPHPPERAVCAANRFAGSGQPLPDEARNDADRAPKGRRVRTDPAPRTLTFSGCRARAPEVATVPGRVPTGREAELPRSLRGTVRRRSR